MTSLLEVLACQAMGPLHQLCMVQLRDVRAVKSESYATGAEHWIVAAGIGGDTVGTLLIAFDRRLCRHVHDCVLGAAEESSPGGRLTVALLNITGLWLSRVVEWFQARGRKLFLTPPVIYRPQQGTPGTLRAAQCEAVELTTSHGHVCCWWLRASSETTSEPRKDDASPAPRLMVVDDCSLVRRIIERTGQRLGYELMSVHDGLAALTALERFSPDVVTLDLNMPGLDGLSCLKHIRATLPTASVLMISADENPAVMAACVEMGAAGFMVKPFRTVELERNLRQVMTHKEYRALHLTSTHHAR